MAATGGPFRTAYLCRGTDGVVMGLLIPSAIALTTHHLRGRSGVEVVVSILLVDLTSYLLWVMATVVAWSGLMSDLYYSDHQ